MSSPKVYLITGANRGLGRGLTSALLLRPNTIVIAGVRTLSSPTTQSLSTLPTGAGSKIVIVTIDNNDETTFPSAIKELQTKHSIDHIDIVIASAGISNNYSLASSTPISEVRSHFETNAVGTLLIFQAVFPLLEASRNLGNDPQFVALSTGAASIGDMEGFPYPATAYGMSKVAVNFLVRKVHFENPWLVAWVISPGWVQTDMGNLGATSNGMKEAPLTVEDSVSGMLAKIDSASRETISGTFQSFDETMYKW